MVGLRVNDQEHPRKGTAMKTVRLFALAMADIASAAREVLLAIERDARDGGDAGDV
jgi:hypothetical protein